MRMPGTLTMLRLLVQTGWMPLDRPMALRYQRRRRASGSGARVLGSSWFGQMGATCLTFVLLWACVISLGGLIVVGVFALTFPLAARIAVAGGLLAIGGGVAMIVNGVSRTMIYEQTRNTWNDLLILPHARHEVILSSVAPAYVPTLFAHSLIISELLAVMTLAVPPPNWWAPVLCVLLLVEWLQLQAVSVALGCASAVGLGRNVNVFMPLLVGALVVVLRAGSGWTLAGVSGVADSTGDLLPLFGPLGGVLLPGAHLVGLELAMLYLVALEVLVRSLFGWAVATRASGERVT